jgi:hypothetical protein
MRSSIIRRVVAWSWLCSSESNMSKSLYMWLPRKSYFVSCAAWQSNGRISLSQIDYMARPTGKNLPPILHV